MRTKRAWSMPEDEARPFLRMLEERIRSSEIEVRHRDALIRLRAIIEEELGAAETALDLANQSGRHAG